MFAFHSIYFFPILPPVPFLQMYFLLFNDKCNHYISSNVFSFRKLLDVKEKVSKYWPEFAQNGKEHITLEQLLVHSVS